MPKDTSAGAKDGEAVEDIKKTAVGSKEVELHARNNMYGAIGAVMACVEKHQFDAARTLLTRV